MQLDEFSITDEQKELCAISVMRTMLLNLSRANGSSFEEMLLTFTSSPVYQGLFDFETGLWREGPDYLQDMFEEMQTNQSQN